MPALPGDLSAEPLRRLGEDLGVCVTHVCFHVRPGLSRHQIAGMLAGCLHGYAIRPLRLLAAVDGDAIGTDSQAASQNRLRDHLVLSVCGERAGLHAALTRVVRFAPPEAALERRWKAAQHAGAAVLAAARPGAEFLALQRTGREEWHRRAAGDGCLLRVSPAGSRSPEDPINENDAVVAGEPFTWRIESAAIAIEDTFLATPAGPALLTSTPDLPSDHIETDAGPFEIPSILSR